MTTRSHFRPVEWQKIKESELVKKWWGVKKRVLLFAFNFGQIALIIILWMAFGWKSIGWIILLAIFIVVILRWKQYKFVIWWMFKLIFGKYPEEFKKGELKNIKFKLVKVKSNEPTSKRSK